MLQPGHHRMLSKQIDDFPNTKQIAGCDPEFQELIVKLHTLYKPHHTTTHHLRPPRFQKIEIPKFGLGPWPAPPSGPVFSGRGLKIKIPHLTFSLLCCPNSEKVWHNPSAPKSLEEIDLAEKSVAWPRGLRNPKLWTFMIFGTLIRPNFQKVGFPRRVEWKYLLQTTPYFYVSLFLKRTDMTQ